MNKRLIYFITLLIAGITCMISCRDELLYDPNEIGEGTAQISASVSFHPLVSALDDMTRADGDAIKKIKDLQLVIYNAKGKFYDNIKLSKTGNNLNIEDEGNSEMPSDPSYPNKSEEKTGTATFNFTLPFGRYYIYVVANCDMGFSEENAGTPAKLKQICVKWNEEDVSANAQMFGCLAADGQKDHDDSAPLLTVNSKTVKSNSIAFHAWIKRLASKVTLVFDGSGLHEGIFVYINKATIRDIPRYCHFGSDNSPFKKDGKYATRENIPANMSDSIISKGESIYYNEKGETLSEPTVETSTDFQYIRNNWLQIDKATQAAGGVKVVDGSPVPHHESVQALYFYENCQGNYPGEKKYCKKQDPDKVGSDFKVTEGQTDKEDYKDEVICGTYIEVEGYYSANYDGYLSSGPIKYRFMLGQDTEYNYNALRNRHYKLTLKFKGYANQPDWHIEYEDHEPGLYPPDEYLMSYMYNVRHEMPIRLTGNPTKVTMQIVENNWAPYDPDEKDLVPNAFIENKNGGLNFEWNKEVYKGSKYWYGLHSVSSKESTPYGSGILEDAESWVSRNVTPIWAGFLGLQAPTGYEDESTPLPTGIYNLRYEYGGIDNFYDQLDTREGMRNYFYGSGDRNEVATNGTLIRPANTIPLYENVYNVPSKIELKSEANTFPSGENNNRTGRNSFKAELNEDESVTIYVPMFTLPKDLGYISGFSGNNPYESYYRKAVVKVTAEYSTDKGTQKIVKFVPVFQTRRMVNPKAVWRTWDDTEPFTVTMMSLDDFADTDFTPLKSMGVWEAWVATPGNEREPLKGGTFTLAPVGQAKEEDGKIKGITGSEVSFQIKFAGVDKNDTECGKIIIHYHNLNCEHSIYVRQGYNVPVKVTDGADDKYWSSYALFSFDSADDTYEGVFRPVRNNSVWTFPEYTIPGLKATLTVNPLALGTMFKRGNYAEGIRIINNKDYPVLTQPGELTLTTGSINTTEKKSWDEIYGIPYLGYNYNSDVWDSSNVDMTSQWQWSTFESTVPDENSDNTYIYDLPTIDDYILLTQQGFGIGVAYADGATETAKNVADAFGFFNTDNSAKESTQGMRGFIVYNLQNFNQIFFPIGFSGVGRRTIQNNDGKPGLLRYGNQAKVLSVENNSNNQYRPIPYNNPNNPGAVYWAKKKAKSEAMFAMDMNYFDLTFGPYDYAVDFVDYGDAVPIKPVVVQRVNKTNNPSPKPRQRSRKK